MTDPVEILSGINFCLVLLFGVGLSASFAGGCKARRDWAVLIALCPVFLVLQAVLWLAAGWDIARRLYPLYVHLPLLLGLIFGLKKPAGISLASICTAYFCCQLPRCGGIIISAITKSALIGEIVYTLIIAPIFFVLLRYFAPSARDTMAESPQSMLLFGSVPILYYIYDYTVIVYANLVPSELFLSDPSYSSVQLAVAVLPVVVGLLYMVYTTAYRRQLRQRTQAELQSSLLGRQLSQAAVEMASLRQAEAQAATYQHDMRHHLAAINAYLEAGKPRQAEKYIKEVQADIEAITPKQFCENELVNLLCSSFSAKAERMGVRLTLETALPGSLAISDTALCALLSNGLENALNAVGGLEKKLRWVEFYCGVRLDKILIEIRNPYAGQISFRDGLPETARAHHGYGCFSIRTIAQLHRGLCEFSAGNGIFTLRVALPM